MGNRKKRMHMEDKDDKKEVTVEDVAEEIRCVYPHLLRGFETNEQALILRVYYQPLKSVQKEYWPEIMEEFHRLSLYVKPANMHLAIENVLGRGYPVPRPKYERTQHTAFEEMQINESHDRRWERERREWVKKKIQREFLRELDHAEATLSSVSRPDVSDNRSRAKVVEMRSVP